MGTGEQVAHSREHQIEELLVAAAKMHAITPRLLDPRMQAENEAHAKRLEEMASTIETNAVHDRARGRK